MLLIEDCEEDELLSRRALRKCGLVCDITAVQDGDAALNEIAAREILGRSLPQLILLDLKLPGRSGADVLRALRASPRTAPLPVIVLTGYSEEACTVMLGDVGPVTTLSKPVQVHAFRRAVSALGIAPLLFAA